MCVSGHGTEPPSEATLNQRFCLFARPSRYSSLPASHLSTSTFPGLLVPRKLCPRHGWFIQWIKQLLRGNLKIWTLFFFFHEYSVVWLIGIRSEVLPGWVVLRFETDYGFGVPVSLHLLIKFKVILGGCSLFCAEWIQVHNGDTAKMLHTYMYRVLQTCKFF